MKISELYNRHENETIYIIGTGPTLRFFPVSFFENKLTIGLNYAWQLIDCVYGLTIHPETIPREYLTYKTKWITKRKDWLTYPNQKQLENTYWFTNNKDVKNYKYLTTGDNTLYVGRGIHTGALALAAKMGAETAILVGCDMDYLGGQHNATGHSVAFHGIPPDRVYEEYYINAKEIRKRLYNHYKLHIFTLSPLLGHRAYDFETLLEERNLSKFEVKEKRSYKRNGLDFIS